jgi:hypothetical protein
VSVQYTTTSSQTSLEDSAWICSSCVPSYVRCIMAGGSLDYKLSMDWVFRHSGNGLRGKRTQIWISFKVSRLHRLQMWLLIRLIWLPGRCNCSRLAVSLASRSSQSLGSKKLLTFALSTSQCTHKQDDWSKAHVVGYRKSPSFPLLTADVSVDTQNPK